MSRKILLSGVHGVGKSYFIKTRLAEINGLSIISASGLISQVYDSEDAGDKRVKDFNENQIILLNSLNKCFSAHKKNVLLDGHLVILDSQDCINVFLNSSLKKE